MLTLRILTLNKLRLSTSPVTIPSTLTAFLNKSHRQYSTQKSKHNNDESKSLATAKEQHELSTDVRPIGERIKENTKTASYMGVILLGVGVTGVMFYAIFRELFSSNSPNNIYSKALDKCINVSLNDN